MDPFVGEIRPFAGNYAPVDWQLCDGSLLSVSDNQALYSLLSTAFGGDGVTNFAVPDLRGRLPIGFGQGTGLSNRVFAAKGGNENVQLGIANAPVHSHSFNVTTAAATDSSPNGKLFANPAPNTFYATTPNPGSAPQMLNTDTVPASGGANQPHENRMPTLAINYIICVNGIYPQRS